MSNLIYYLRHDKRQLLDSIVIVLGRYMSDKLYLSLRYRIKMGRWINWKQPQDFTEKIQWLKVNDHNMDYVKMVDKDLVKNYVASIIGWDYIIPTIGRWNSIEEISWESLPEQFVMKTTHGGGNGGVYICKNKFKVNKYEVFEKMKESLSQNIYQRYREWPYKEVTPRLIAEAYIESESTQELSDYKFFCFNGTPKYCQVIRDRRKNETIDFYDEYWNHMPFVGLNPKCKNGLNPVEKPSKLSEMIDICKKIAAGIPFCRVDLYYVNFKIYFGEITFYPGSGLGKFKPREWNKKLGNLIDFKYENYTDAINPQKN